MGEVKHYEAQYGNFASELYARVRAATFGEDIGQNGWQTADEQDMFIGWLDLGPESRLLDVACGSGGPTMRIARLTGCSVQGIDVLPSAVAEGRAGAEAAGLGERASFIEHDGSDPLPFEAESFDALICIDAVNHLPDRARVVADWAKVLRPGGKLVFTDPIVVTGPLSNIEIATRASIGYFLFVAPGIDERLLDEAGFEVIEVLDRTENMARMAARWRDARAEHEDDLRRVEGDETYDGQQTFFDVAATLASERRLSRFAFHARRR